MAVPVWLPEIGANEPVRISCWLVEPGEVVDAGDRLVELLISGMTFDVPAPASGTLQRIEIGSEMTVKTGDLLGWIEES